MEIEHLEAAADMAMRVTYTGSALGSILAFINANAGALSFMVAVVGLLVNIYYRRKAHRVLMKRPLYRGYYGAAKYSQEHLQKERRALELERAQLKAEREALDQLKK